MIRLKYYFISLSIALSLVIAGVIILPVHAQAPELSQEKIELIQDHCVSAQSAIQRTQKSDLVARTNQGRSYEYITGLMASLNSRIALNKLSQPRMSEVTTQLQGAFSAFHDHYTQYTMSVDNALGINCETEPVRFYEALESVRAQRSQLTTDTQSMRQLIDEYAQSVAALQEEVK